MPVFVFTLDKLHLKEMLLKIPGFFCSLGKIRNSFKIGGAL